jgi:hypothetical protein
VDPDEVDGMDLPRPIIEKWRTIRSDA